MSKQEEPKRSLLLDELKRAVNRLDATQLTSRDISQIQTFCGVVGDILKRPPTAATAVVIETTLVSAAAAAAPAAPVAGTHPHNSGPRRWHETLPLQQAQAARLTFDRCAREDAFRDWLLVGDRWFELLQFQSSLHVLSGAERTWTDFYQTWVNEGLETAINLSRLRASFLYDWCHADAPSPTSRFLMLMQQHQLRAPHQQLLQLAACTYRRTPWPHWTRDDAPHTQATVILLDGADCMWNRTWLMLLGPASSSSSLSTAAAAAASQKIYANLMFVAAMRLTLVRKQRTDRPFHQQSLLLRLQQQCGNTKSMTDPGLQLTQMPGLHRSPAAAVAAAAAVVELTAQHASKSAELPTWNEWFNS